MNNNLLFPKVFTDFHHASLLNSLIMLFEGRMNGKVYRPIGIEWAEKGFWKVYDHPATQAQYLGVGSATPDGTPPLNEVGKIEGVGSGDGNAFVYHCQDIDSGLTNKAITFDGFMANDFDIVIASIPQHIEPFRRLCDMHPSKPKLIYQIGNAWPQTPDIALVDGILSSAHIDWGTGRNFYSKPFVEYHQEFDLNVFNYREPTGSLLVSSFVNCFSEASIFGFDWAIFQAVEKALPNFTFKSYGGQCRDGAMHGSKELSDKMADSCFIWHTKYGGDGYGHVIHNAAACGRPLIVRKEYYRGKLAEPLLVDGETCIAIDGLGVNEIVEKMKYYAQPMIHRQMCQAMYERFKQVVDFDREYDQIRAFLAML